MSSQFMVWCILHSLTTLKWALDAKGGKLFSGKSVVLTHISLIIRQPHLLIEYQKYQLLSETGVYADDLQEMGAQKT